MLRKSDTGREYVDEGEDSLLDSLLGVLEEETVNESVVIFIPDTAWVEAEQTQEGHWVTIRGRPIFIKAPRAETKNKVNPNEDKDGDGISDEARVGVRGDSTPPPPPIPRLAHLTVDEKKVETAFATAFEKDPDGMVRQYIAQVRSSDSPNTFSTDDAKLMSGDYATSNDTKAAYNLAVHQTANALAKRAFVQYLDDVVVKLPLEKRMILVTAGGVASGKGYALKNTAIPSAASDLVGAIWDTAGEQNSTELPWVLKQARARGLATVYAYVDANHKLAFDRVISRAQDSGRMVDADLYADSYAIGAKNFKAFNDKHGKDPDVQILFISNRGTPSMLSTFPTKALVNRDDVYKDAQRVLKKRARELSPAIVRGATVGHRLWH